MGDSDGAIEGVLLGRPTLEGALLLGTANGGVDGAKETGCNVGFD